MFRRAGSASFDIARIIATLPDFEKFGKYAS